MMERLVMYKATDPKEGTHSLLKVTPEVHSRVKDLSKHLNRLPIDVASELITWALERVEIGSEAED